MCLLSKPNYIIMDIIQNFHLKILKLKYLLDTIININ